MKRIDFTICGTLALALAAAATPATADHAVIYAPRAEAAAASSAPQGPYNATAAYHVVNGVAQPGDTQQGPGGTVSGGGSATQSWAQVSQPGGYVDLSFNSGAYAAADLAAGTLKASTTTSGQEFFGGPLGFANARLDDTIFFNNTSGSAVTVGFTYSFDGKMTNPYAANGANPGGSVSLSLGCFSGTCYNDAGDRIVFATGPTRTPNDTWQYFWDYKNVGSCFGENLYCGQGAAPYFQWGLNQPNAGGIVDGWISTQLLIPTGLSSIGLSGRLNLDCRGASSCDFGHTGKFGFGALPDGLTYSSASGVFLTAGAPGPVPEPASWMMLIIGFGAIGGAMRQKRGAHAVLA